METMPLGSHMQLTFLGGTGSVTGSEHLVLAGGSYTAEDAKCSLAPEYLHTLAVEMRAR